MALALNIYTLLRLARPVRLLALLLLVICTGCQPQRQQQSLATPVIGIVTASIGYPEVIRKHQTYILATQSRIYTDDVLTTDKNSRLVITMKDGATFKLGPNTHLVLHHYDLAADQQLTNAEATLSSGSVLTSIPSNPNQQDPLFEIRKPVATILASATEFWSGFAFTDNTLDVSLMGTGGKVVIENNHGEVELLQRYDGTSVIGDSAPQVPKPWDAQKIQQGNAQISLVP